MANVSRVNGLKPYKYLNGAKYNGSVTEYFIPNNNASNVFVGDPVKLSTDGDTAAVGGLAKGVRSVVPAAATDATVGVVVGFKLDPTNLNTPQFRAASAGRYVLVADDPNLLFEVQSNGTTSVADVGLNASYSIAAGSTTTGSSGVQLDQATVAVTATLPLKIVEFSQRQDNDATSANAKLIVKINNHQLGAGTGTAGV
jgi:hypothetical protein